MAAASIAIVGLLLVVTYEFLNSGSYSDSSKWMHYTHLGIFAAIFFSVSAFFGLVHKVPSLKENYQKYLYFGMILTFLIGWVFLFYVLCVLFTETY